MLLLLKRPLLKTNYFSGRIRTLKHHLFVVLLISLRISLLNVYKFVASCVCSHLLKKSLMGNFIFWAVLFVHKPEPGKTMLHRQHSSLSLCFYSSKIWLVLRYRKQLLQLLLDFHMLGFLLKGVLDLLHDKCELGKARSLKSNKEI